jgi:probable F420-dependent oxidoreductase
MGFRVDTGMYRSRLGEAAAAAMRAEALGYDAITTAETSHDPFLPLTLAAEHTSRIQIGTSVAIAFPRSPMVTAMTAWELQGYSKGRFILGLGTQVKGHNERRFSVPWSPPAPRIREYVESLRAIWTSFQTGGPLEYVGKHYAFTLMTPNFNPGPIEHPAIPVHIAAVNAANARMAGEVCDGIKLHSFNTMPYTRDVILPAVLQGLSRSARQRDDFAICGALSVVTGKTWSDVEQSLHELKRTIGFYGSTRTYQAVFEHHGLGDLTARLHDLSVKGKWQEMTAAISDDMVSEFGAIGTYDTIASVIRERWLGVLDRVSFDIPVNSPDDEDAVRAIVQQLQAA